MSAATQDAIGRAMVQLGYGATHPASDGALSFRVGFTALEGALGAVRGIGHYNDFDGDKVAGALREIGAMVEPYWPNRFSVGREGSPVVYVAGLDADEQKRAAEILYRVGADEISADAAGELRAWWD